LLAGLANNTFLPIMGRIFDEARVAAVGSADQLARLSDVEMASVTRVASIESFQAVAVIPLVLLPIFGLIWWNDKCARRLVYETRSAPIRFTRLRGFSTGSTCKPGLGDAELCREVEALLAKESSPSSLSGPPRVSAVIPGFQLGTYRIEAQLGEGGMGVAYRAHDTKLNRPVAVKFLSDGLADTSARRRFQREAQMASSLNHPHILTVYDAGEFEGRQFLVTEFVDGGTLKSWVRAEKHTWREIVELLVGVADGLAAAHQAGILHRDIKPENKWRSASRHAASRSATLLQ
jgi:predicted Ser/Thr protein kinase